MKIYHNSQCSKSNAALELIKQNGIEPQVIEYIYHVPSRDELIDLLQRLALKPLELIRQKEPLFQQNFKGMTFSDEQWIEIMRAHPILIERPIVIHGDKAVIARPVERLLDLL